MEEQLQDLPRRKKRKQRTQLAFTLDEDGTIDVDEATNSVEVSWGDDGDVGKEEEDTMELEQMENGETRPQNEEEARQTKKRKLNHWGATRQSNDVEEGVSSSYRIPKPKKDASKRVGTSANTVSEGRVTTRNKNENSKGKGKAKVERAKKGKGKGKAESDFVPSIEWPEHFKQLERVFKAINTVYTFVSTRKQLATTFESMKTSVEGLLKRPLEISDLAQIKSLLPQLITFSYIDSEMLRVHLEGSSSGSHSSAKDDSKTLGEDSKADTDKGKGKGRGKDEDVYEAMAFGDKRDKGAGEDREREKEKEQQVLFFAFNDGEVKPTGGGGKTKSKKSKKSTISIGKFTTEGMSKMVEKRNEKFKEAVDELLVACEVQGQDPLALLLSASAEHIPVQISAPSILGGDDLPSTSQIPLSSLKADLDFYLSNPDKRPNVDGLIRDLMDNDEFYRGQIGEGGRRVIEERDGKFGELSTPLSPTLLAALSTTRSITSLYTHQSQAINHLSSTDHCRSVIVSTSTSSGKSLIYQIPTLMEIEIDRDSTAVLIFPTKALAQDQMRSLGELLKACGEGWEDVKIATYDGDTPQTDREYIRQNASVIFTNPDMLHVSILPNEESWRRFFRNLKIVVVDELHYYGGLFGSHVAFIMRRLRRICAALGNHEIKFVSCSATVSNPAEHMKAIFGVEDVEVVDDDGSPSGKKEYVIWNPPLIDQKDITQGRVSNINEASRIFRYLMSKGVRCIVFCKVRKICEIMMKQIRADLMAEGRNDIASRVMAYRSGYSPEDRRRIEKEMFSGQLLGIVATTALELGIDIGSLDAVITLGFPYTLPGFRQQAGRAGRRNKDSLAMLICDPWPIDQHYAKHPEELFDSAYAKLSLDLTNPIVLEGHLQCAAEEVPLHPIEDQIWFGRKDLLKLCKERLYADDQGFYHCHPRYRPNPARHVPIRATEDEVYQVVDVTNGKNKILEEVEWSRAVFEIYEGAVFMHQGMTFIVKHLNHDTKIAQIRAASIDWTTRQRDFTDVDAIEALRIRALKNSPCRAFYGRIKITSMVFGYYKVDRKNNILDTVDIQTPPFTRDSHGLWLDVPDHTLSILRSKNIHIAGAIHAAEHALLSLTPIFVMSQAGDVKTECKAPEKELASTMSSRKRPARLTLYDATKSSGVCAKAFDHLNALLETAADTIKNCPCDAGCPSCVAATTCNEGNIVLAKLGASIVLECLLGREIDLDKIQYQEPLQRIAPSSIESAAEVRHSDDVVVLGALDGTSTPLEGEERNRVLTQGTGVTDEGIVLNDLDQGGFLHTI